MDPKGTANLPVFTREAPIASVNLEQRTVELIWSTGARVKRYDWMRDRQYWEELSLDPKHVRMERLTSGKAPLLDNHSRWEGVRAVIGVVEKASLGKEAPATVRFSAREDVQPILQDVHDKIIRNVSAGYATYRVEMIPPEKPDDLWIYRAVDWEPLELSLVPIGADSGAETREFALRAGERSFPCEFITPAGAAADLSTTQERTMDPKNGPQGGAPAAEPNAGSKDPTPEQRAAIAKEERARVEGIRTRAEAQGLKPEFYQPLIDNNKSLDEACRAMVDEVAARKAPEAPLNPTRVAVVEDERVKLRGFVSAALVHRVNPTGKLLEGAGDFRYMNMLRLAEEVLTREGQRVKGMAPMEIAQRALHSTSDFPNILADASNKRLRQAYDENAPSYTRWARRGPNAPDFKTINVTMVSGAPDLQKVLEGGEFKRGSMSDGKETYQVFTYGRIISYTRQAMVNDDLGALDRTPRSLAAAGRRLENRTVYGVLTGNANMADGGALFNATAYTPTGSGHANLGTGTGSALGTGTLAVGRTAMRLQKGKQNEELNVAPSFLIVPATLEQTAYQLTSANYVPATPAAVNEFRQGGKTALDPIVESLLDASSTTAWYLAASPGQIDTVEYCYLDGSEGMSIEQQIGFVIDGIDLKARLDFAAAPIDFRGLYKANGA